jgi:hypothetical protein
MGINQEWAKYDTGEYWRQVPGETEEDRVARIQQVCANGPYAFYDKTERVGEKPQPVAPTPSYMKTLRVYGELAEAVDNLDSITRTLMIDRSVVQEEKPSGDCGSSLQAFLDNFPDRIRNTTARVMYTQSMLESILFEGEGETK